MSHHEPLSLYLHIPFCSLKCRYCDFNSYAGLDKLVPPYVDALITEMGLWQQAVRGRPVRRRRRRGRRQRRHAGQVG